jgi:hypothetical protein
MGTNLALTNESFLLTPSKIVLIKEKPSYWLFRI